jgi:hypothetical protein
MDDNKWERWSALGGIVFVVLILASAFLPGSPPKPGDSAVKIAKFVTDKGDEIRWAGYLGAIAAVPLFWFAGGVWRLLRRAEGGNPRLTVVAVLGLGFAALSGALGGVILGALGILGVSGSGGLSSTRFFYVLSFNVGALTSFGAAVFVGAFSIVIVRSAVLPTVMGWLGGLVAILFLIGGAVVTSTRDAFFTISLVSFFAFAVWLLIVSGLMLRAPSSETAVSAT